MLPFPHHGIQCEQIKWACTLSQKKFKWKISRHIVKTDWIERKEEEEETNKKTNRKEKWTKHKNPQTNKQLMKYCILIIASFFLLCVCY